MEELFRWQLATETFDESFIPKAQYKEGDKFIVMKLEGADIPNDFKVGEILIFDTVTKSRVEFVGRGAILYWCQIKPYKEP